LDLVLKNFQVGTDGTDRRTAAAVLASATLNLDTKRLLARDYLPSADTLILTTAMQVFEGESDPVLGARIVEGLVGNEDAADLMTTVQLDRVLDSFPESVYASAGQFKEQLEASDGELTKRFLRLEPGMGTGDVGRGRRIFFGELAACSSCHAIGDEGGTIGPDLTTIGLVRSPHDLLEAVLFPSSSMVPDFQTYIVETKDDLLSGIIGREVGGTITLHTGAEETRTLDRDDVIAMDPSPISVMPEGLDSGLTDGEVNDLITFLLSLNDDKFLEPTVK
jgi:putative heme-binding domain-containing protein